MDAATMVQIMAKPSVQKLMQDPAMARMMQDPLSIEQQIAQLREAANGEKLSQEDGDKVREMLSMQLGVSPDKVDEFLEDLDRLGGVVLGPVLAPPPGLRARGPAAAG